MSTAVSEADKVTYDEAARILGKSPATIRDWASKGLIARYHKPLDKRVYVSLAEIERLLSQEPRPKGE